MEAAQDKRPSSGPEEAAAITLSADLHQMDATHSPRKRHKPTTSSPLIELRAPPTAEMIAEAYKNCSELEQKRVRDLINKGSRSNHRTIYTCDDLPHLSATEWKRFIGGMFRAAR